MNKIVTIEIRHENKIYLSEIDLQLKQTINYNETIKKKYNKINQVCTIFYDELNLLIRRATINISIGLTVERDVFI